MKESIPKIVCTITENPPNKSHRLSLGDILLIIPDFSLPPLIIIN